MGAAALILLILGLTLSQLIDAGPQSSNTTCTTGDIQHLMKEHLAAHMLTADDLVAFNEKKMEDPERAVRVWSGRKGKMNLSVYRQENLRVPMEVFMSEEGSSFTVDVVVQTGVDGFTFGTHIPFLISVMSSATTTSAHFNEVSAAYG